MQRHPYIAQVRGFARGEAECNIWAHNARVWYPISDLLQLRNDVLIGYAYNARGENLCFYENLYAYIYRNVNYMLLYIPHVLTNQMN